MNEARSSNDHSYALAFSVSEEYSHLIGGFEYKVEVDAETGEQKREFALEQYRGVTCQSVQAGGGYVWQSAKGGAEFEVLLIDSEGGEESPVFVVGIFQWGSEAPVIFGGCLVKEGESGCSRTRKRGESGASKDPEGSYQMREFALQEHEPLKKENRVVISPQMPGGREFDILTANDTGLSGTVKSPEYLHEGPGGVTIWRVDWDEPTETGPKLWSYIYARWMNNVIGSLVFRIGQGGQPFQRPGVFAAENHNGGGESG
ncbi:MAG: hypothetical protein AAGD01_17375 [Acidobacteriota bacterium]